MWLAQSKRKYLDEISSKDARRYFDKFVDKWNRGRLPGECPAIVQDGSMFSCSADGSGP